MAYYNECPHCGACLDPGERCDCEQKKTAAPKHDDLTSNKSIPSFGAKVKRGRPYV